MLKVLKKLPKIKKYFLSSRRKLSDAEIIALTLKSALSSSTMRTRKEGDKDKDKDKHKGNDGRKAQSPETAWHLALEELGDVEENCEEQDGEEVGEQVVPVLSCVLLPSGDIHEDEDGGHDDVD